MTYTFDDIQRAVDLCIKDFEDAAALTAIIMPNEAYKIRSTLVHQISAVRSILDKFNIDEER
jgi:hypothetical protein